MSLEAVPDAPSRVLIVDDDPDFAASLALLLEMEGYDITVAHDGAGAHAALAGPLAAGPAVALVDIRLGHEDGVALATALIGARPELLAVMVTAYASVPTAIRALQAGIYDYVCKPFEPAELLAILSRCFDRHRLARERAQAEELLRRSRRMEAVGRLSAGIAHDFNNLLTVVGGSLKLLQEEMSRGPAGDAAIMRELVVDALGAVEEGILANRRLLAVGRAQPLLPRVLDLGDAVEQVVSRARHAFGAGVTLELRPPPAACLALADPHQLEASLLNLIFNARDAVAGSGAVRVGLDTCDLPPGSALLLGDMAPGLYAGIEVEDDGCGMATDIAENALQPFFSTKPAESGSGLGLPTAYGFARQSGGNLLIESEAGVGTRVTLLLPAMRPRP
ncbi:response regulator [Ancylobacter vacuolatus]|uniref:histidine kinase n=1 Tax=Ancylobacter vacuolatus TaxID=223389 RepID=A0ABU0DCF5_9HYPH|nr:response regulator [Ancylobacter vacuolatus]MDQ0346062.1 signal transduction histidine kinase [Ancylobacter vacuolatus]